MSTSEPTAARFPDAPVPARRSPAGFVAQRLFPDAQAGHDEQARRWVLVCPSDLSGLHVDLLTDDEVADWPQLHEQGEPLAEMQCPACSATTRARLADQPDGSSR